MRFLLPLLAAAVVIPCIPAHAQTLLPYLYAYRYCALRRMGATDDDARRQAIRDSVVSGNDWVMVNSNGHQVRSDAVESARAVVQLCPQYSFTK